MSLTLEEQSQIDRLTVEIKTMQKEKNDIEMRLDTINTRIQCTQKIIWKIRNNARFRELDEKRKKSMTR